MKEALPAFEYCHIQVGWLEVILTLRAYARVAIQIGKKMNLQRFLATRAYARVVSYFAKSGPNL